jgi:hypothetical protein
MQIDDKLWLYNGFYIDIDELGQLRIVGPNNHLYYGSAGIYADRLSVGEVGLRLHELRLHITLRLDDGFLPDPAMGHIRQVREEIQIFGEPTRSFASVNVASPGLIAPTNISSETDDDISIIRYTRAYGEHFYGVVMTFEKGVKLHRDDLLRGFRIEGAGEAVNVIIDTDTDEMPESYNGHIFTEDTKEIGTQLKSAANKRLWERTTAEISHLIQGRKTSGFDYGTVFPRDWMETADLLSDELTDETYRFMYSESLRHVNEQGAGWHEDIIGEFSYERQQEIERLASGFDMFIDPGHPASPQFRKLLEQLDELFVTRMMIDIEPHYLLGLKRMDFTQFSEGDQVRFRHVAKFIMKRAQREPLISFNKLALPFKRHRGDEYYHAGNWRDSLLAYQQIGPMIAPYDVNAVLYPEALKMIAANADELHVDGDEAMDLAEEWSHKAEHFRFTDRNGRSVMGLALYAPASSHALEDFKLLRVSHTDEAYSHLYGTPERADVTGFAERLVMSEYFYTPSGPTVVGSGMGYDHTQYHGEVIWTKQTALIIRGLQKQAKRAESEGWTSQERQAIRNAVVRTSKASLDAFVQLDAIPELHYDDMGKARLYTDQPHPEGQMNTVQLWSAAGARVILRAIS